MAALCLVYKEVRVSVGDERESRMDGITSQEV